MYTTFLWVGPGLVFYPFFSVHGVRSSPTKSLSLRCQSRRVYVKRRWCSVPSSGALLPRVSFSTFLRLRLPTSSPYRSPSYASLREVPSSPPLLRRCRSLLYSDSGYAMMSSDRTIPSGGLLPTRDFRLSYNCSFLFSSPSSA